MNPVHRFRQGLEFEVEALERYLSENLPEFQSPLQVTQFPGGQSNPTYRVDTRNASYVLRRKPPGNLVPSAHAIEREYRVMLALSMHTQFPVAKPLLFCEETAVIGTAFYLVEFVEGRIFWEPSLPDLSRDARQPIYDAMISTLADLHAIDYRAIGLEDFGRSEGYVARQVARWSKQYVIDSEAAGRIPALEKLIEWLPKNAPLSTSAPTIVHGDYRLDNLMFDRSAPRIGAVLDWELSTIGEPLADFAYHLMIYRMASGGVRGLYGVDLGALGIPSEQQYVAAYCARRGLDDIPDLTYYLAFCMFRLAAICHGIGARVHRGTAVNPEAAKYAAQVEPLAELALQTASSRHTHSSAVQAHFGDRNE